MTVAVAQLGVLLGDAAGNARRAVTCLEEAATEGAEFVVFPECCLTGYVVDDRAEAAKMALDAGGPELGVIRDACGRLGVHTVIGYLERDGESVFNTVALYGPEGLIGSYRKRHLPPLGADRFIDASDDVESAVFETAVGRIGIAICYEIRFPEVMRTLALAGAEMIVLPTNWPVQSTMLADHFTRVRAAENLVYLLVANRGDSERGTDFLGNSQIVDPFGQVLAKADRGEALLLADVDLSRARDKTIRFPTSDLELSPWRDRRPAGYRI